MNALASSYGFGCYINLYVVIIEGDFIVLQWMIGCTIDLGFVYPAECFANEITV